MVSIAKFLLRALAGFPKKAHAAPSFYPTGVTFYNPEKAYNGFTLIGTDKPRLIDMNGNLVKIWEGNGMPNKALPGGKMMTCGKRWEEGQQDQTSVKTLDFEGNVLWEFRRGEAVAAIEGEPREGGKTWIARQHHDYQRRDTAVYYVPGTSPVPDKTERTLILAHFNEHNADINAKSRLLSDILYEADADGNVIWSWKMSDHVDEMGLSPYAFAAMRTYPPIDNPTASRHAETDKIGAGYDWIHVNCASYLGENKWFDAGDTRFAPDNILINSREANVMMIVDRESEKIVWRTGPYFEPGTPDFALGHTSGAHAVHMIPRGLPGEGNILIFDNGGPSGYGMPNENAPITGFHPVRRSYSRIVEFNPVSKTIVWEYDWHKNHKGLLGHMDCKFFSPFVSNVQRMPNGNTVITEGDMGRIFEITQDYELVWEYMSPYGKDTQNLLYRTYRLGYEWMPKAKHAEEVAVIPPENNVFYLPNAKGEYPNTGV